jgi:hypothetical protein
MFSAPLGAQKGTTPRTKIRARTKAARETRAENDAPARDGWRAKCVERWGSGRVPVAACGLRLLSDDAVMIARMKPRQSGRHRRRTCSTQSPAGIKPEACQTVCDPTRSRPGFIGQHALLCS